MSTGRTLLLAAAMLAASVWVGSLVCLAIVSSASRTVLDGPARVALFRRVGRLYGMVGTGCLASAIIAGVVERGELREFTERVLLERIFLGLRAKGNQGHFNKLFGRTGQTRLIAPIGRHKILTVVLHERRSGTFVVKQKDLASQPLGIETITDRKSAQPRHDDPERIDLLTAGQCQNRNRSQSKQSHGNPEQLFSQAHCCVNVPHGLRFRHRTETLTA